MFGYFNTSTMVNFTLLNSSCTPDKWTGSSITFKAGFNSDQTSIDTWQVDQTKNRFRHTKSV